jgi:anti-anti-sigma factor
MRHPRSATVLALYGRLVHDTVQSLEPMLAGLLVVERPRLIVDLSEVADCDPAGAAMLARAARLARQQGGELRIAAPSAAVGPWLHPLDVAVFGTVDGAVEADQLDLVGPAPCIEPLEVWRSPHASAFGAGRSLWRVRHASRSKVRTGPASQRP